MEENDQAPDNSGAQPCTVYLVIHNGLKLLPIGWADIGHIQLPDGIDGILLEPRLPKDVLELPDLTAIGGTAFGTMQFDLEKVIQDYAAAVAEPVVHVRERIMAFVGAGPVQSAQLRRDIDDLAAALKDIPPLTFPISCGPGDRGRNDGDDGPPKGHRGYIPAPETYKAKKHRNNGKQLNTKRRKWK